MAKSKNFFGKRKGSTKSLTFSTLSINGTRTQITKDRVKYVKNPNTEAQQWQRAKVNAAEWLASYYPSLSNFFKPYYKNYPSTRLLDNPFFKLNLGKNGISKIYYGDNGDILSDAILSTGYFNDLPNLVFAPRLNTSLAYPAFANFPTMNYEEFGLEQAKDAFRKFGIDDDTIVQFYLYSADGPFFVMFPFTISKVLSAGIANDGYHMYTDQRHDVQLSIFYFYDQPNTLFFFPSIKKSPAIICACAAVYIKGKEISTTRMQLSPMILENGFSEWKPIEKVTNSKLYLNTGLDGVDINGGSTAAVVEAVNKANAAKANAAKEYRKKLENEFLQNEMLEGNGLSDTIIQ